MEQNWVIVNSNESATNFHREELPDIISEQVILLNTLDEKVKVATKRAEDAKSSADFAAGKSTGLFKKGAAIEAIQASQIDIAKAVISGAEAQKVAFQFQTQLSQITKYLFGLGVTNLALNRSVVRELKLKLEGASSEELSDLAKQEILNVIKQLKAQEDLLQKQEELDKKIKLVRNSQDDLINWYGKEFQAQITEVKKINEKIKVQAEVVNRHDTELKLQTEVDRQFAKEIKVQVESYQRHDEELRELTKKYKIHEELLSYLAKQEEEHNRTIVALKKDMSLSHTTISQKLMFSYMMGGIGALLAVGALLLTSLK